MVADEEREMKDEKTEQLLKQLNQGASASNLELSHEMQIALMEEKREKGELDIKSLLFQKASAISDHYVKIKEDWDACCCFCGWEVPET